MIDFGHGITLAPLDSGHLARIRLWRNDERIRTWCRQYDLISEQAHSEWFERQAKDPTIRMYAIYDNGIVGVCGLTSIDQVNRRAEFSLYIDPGRHGNGLGERALKTLLHHGFYNLGLNCIWGETFEGNPAAKMFERLGMKEEGRRRDFYYRNGRFIDARLFSVLRADFDLLLQNGAPGRTYPRPEVTISTRTCADLKPFAIQAR